MIGGESESMRTVQQRALSVQGDGLEQPLEEKSRRGWRWSVVFAVWFVVVLILVAPIYFQYAGGEIPTSRLFSEIAGWLLWVLFFPLIFWAGRRFPLERPSWKRHVVVHVVLGTLVAVVYSLLDVLKSYLIIAFSTRDFRPHVFSMGLGYIFSSLEFYLLIYTAVLAVVHAVELSHKFQDRELKSIRLEAKLAQTQLQVLRMQLHPHFLFNTLHAISALMHKNVHDADRMIVMLSDFLRLSLENAGEQEVTLRREIDFLMRYVEIEQTRFGDRLSVRVDIAPAILDARVPNLILQPLVENAICHGISKQLAPGRIDIRGRKDSASQVRLEVEDNGPGVSHEPDFVLPLGIGLANTKARLEQLYGTAHRFAIGNAPGGGFLVSLSFPYEPLEPSPDDGELLRGRRRASSVSAIEPA